MASRGGRDQLGPMERLVKMLAVLQDAGADGVGQEKLIDAAGFTGTPESCRRMVNREIGNLRRGGWEIENIADAGENARYVLKARDTLVGVDLSPRHQAELARVVRMSALDGFSEYVSTRKVMPEPTAVVRDPSYPSPDEQQLMLCISAAAKRCRLSFTYKRRYRAVNPRVVHPGPSGWYLAGCEDGETVEKLFAVARMTDLTLDAPGTAHLPAQARRSSFDPATWEVDPPVHVTIEASPAFAGQVAMTLRATDQHDHDGQVRMTVRVTNRSAFRRRLYGLGRRVRVIGPDEVREEIVSELSAWAEAT